MAIALLDAGSDSGDKPGSSGLMTYTVSAGTDRILLVSVGAGDTTSQSVSGINWNSVGMTLVPSSRVNNGAAGWCEWWYQLNPVATTASVAVTLTSAPTSRFAFGAITFTGVDQSTIFDAVAQVAQNTGTAISASITTATSGAEVLGTAFMNVDPTITPALTVIYTLHVAGFNNAYVAERTTKSPAGVQAVDWTIGTSASWVESVIALKPTSAPAILMGDQLNY